MFDAWFAFPALAIASAVVLGLLVGSFLNVVILRIPPRMEWQWKRDAREILELPAVDDPEPPGIVVKSSHCPTCGHTLAAWENIPVLSWLAFGALLLGRWRYGWRGAKALRWTLIAMALLLLAFFGSNLVLELVLQRR